MPETFVIGAGPYGISLATHLRARQVPFEIVGEPMQSWRKHMPPGMVLKSEPFASSLWDPDRVFSLEKFCELRGASYDAIGTPVPLYKFLSYADWFQQQTKLDIRNRTLVRLVRTAAGFDLTFADGERTAARRVVLATGHLPYRWVPPALRDLPAELASHSSDHCDLGRFAGRDVTIVGSGQSGLETAAMLHEQGTTTRVLARASQIYWNGAPKPDRSFLSQARWPDSGIGIGLAGMDLRRTASDFSSVAGATAHSGPRNQLGPGWIVVAKGTTGGQSPATRRPQHRLGAGTERQAAAHCAGRGRYSDIRHRSRDRGDRL